MPALVLPWAVLVLTAVSAAPPLVDREAKPEEWGYRPAENQNVEVNPPALSWVASEKTKSYSIELAPSAAFQNAIRVEAIPWSVYTHNRALTPGKWFWRYQPADGPWSKPRSFVIPPQAVPFPQPTLDELRARIPKTHPRLFARPEDRERLNIALQSMEGRRLLEVADGLAKATPTAEPSVKASSKDPATNQYWWSNRVQTVKALQEAEVLTFAWWLTREERYKDPARRFTLALAAWDPDGPTNFTVNCEAAKPMLHRLARAYDWGHDLFTAGERAQIRAMLLRRAQDAWKSGEARQGAGHLNEPYGSHANRLWHKLAENAIATLGDTRESELFLHYAVSKFFAAYPVWSDDDGGWHEGLSYFAGYMSKAAWWFHIARTSLGIDGFRKPFFKHFGDYPLYSAPPGSPDMGLGDLSFRPVSQGWSFMDFFVGETGNPYWAWWTQSWNIRDSPDEPVLAFLWSARTPVTPKPPVDLPTSKLFRGTGVAILNSTLLSAADNVQVRFKSSPMGRWSHGHDPQNSFTLNAYGETLLVNNVYRDLYGSPFHAQWCWGTRSQNAVLVNGEGQKSHSYGPAGRIVKSQFTDTFDFIAGDAAAPYEGKLEKAFRYVLFLKPDAILIVDDLEAPSPSTFQWMLHALDSFSFSPGSQHIELKRGKAQLQLDYLSSQTLQLKQWSGYEPEPDHRYLASIKSPGIPSQQHLEAATTTPALRGFTVLVLRPSRSGQSPVPFSQSETGSQIQIKLGGTEVILNKTGGDFALVRKAEKTWRLARAERGEQ